MKHQIIRLPIEWSKGISIFCFGDLQEGSQGFSAEDWAWFLEEFHSTPNAYALGVGDYQDFLRPSMRSRIQGSLASDLSAQQQLETLIVRDQDRFIKESMKSLAGRMIGLHSGHHEYELLNGGNTSMRLASALGAPYLGWIGSTRLMLEPKGKGGGYSYTIVSTHGSGGGRSPATDIRAMNDLANSFICDQVVRGHSCKSLAATPMIRHIINRRGAPGYSMEIPRLLQVGGFCKSYTDGWKSSYAERAGYMPQPLSWGVIRIKLAQDRRRDDEDRAGQSRKEVYLDVENVTRGRGLMAPASKGEENNGNTSRLVGKDWAVGDGGEGGGVARRRRRGSPRV